MDAIKPTILFTLHYLGKEYKVQTFKDQYYSLMNLVSVHLGIPGFGLCSGMGSCGTCRVGINDGYQGKEKTVLSCDIKVDDELSNTIITLAEPGY